MAKKILIADDENEVLDLLRCALEPSGYDVECASHGGQLPSIVKNTRPDLLILDVMMPGLDGYSLALQLAQNDETKDIPVIVVSALPAARALFEKFSQVKAFLDKPFNTDKLLADIGKILGE